MTRHGLSALPAGKLNCRAGSPPKFWSSPFDVTTEPAAVTRERPAKGPSAHEQQQPSSPNPRPARWDNQGGGIVTIGRLFARQEGAASSRPSYQDARARRINSSSSLATPRKRSRQLSDTTCNLLLETLPRSIPNGSHFSHTTMAARPVATDGDVVVSLPRRCASAARAHHRADEILRNEA